jgi:DNA-binding transcriptional LysR family regulator
VDLVHEGFDLAIRIGPLADSRLAARRLGELRYGLYAAPAYLQRCGMPRHPSELSAHDLILFSPAGKPVPLRLQDTDGRVETIEAAPRLRVDSRYAQRDATLAGLGIAENLDAISAEDVAAGRLMPVLPGWMRAPAPVHAVFPSQRYLTPKVRVFVEHALAHFPTMRSG